MRWSPGIRGFDEVIVVRVFQFASLVLVVIGVAGCGSGGLEPRMRYGCYPTPTLGTSFPDPYALGRHGYASGGSERQGIVYTCRGGHIDIAHVRIAADWTAYLKRLSYKALLDGERRFSFRSKPAPSRYFVEIEYPRGWDRLRQSQKEIIARDVSLEMGQYLGFAASTWHEILTWFGYKFVGFLSEFASAFSWEDSFSNLLGTRIGLEALQDGAHSYDEAVTLAIERQLRLLGAQPREVAKRVSESLRGKWFSGHVVYMVSIKRRNFDIGLDDGYVTPTLVPGVLECRLARPVSYPVPRLERARRYGFDVNVEIEPRVWEGPRILKAVRGDAARNKKRINVASDFPAIMDYIKRDSLRRFGRDVEKGP